MSPLRAGGCLSFRATPGAAPQTQLGHNRRRLSTHCTISLSSDTCTPQHAGATARRVSFHSDTPRATRNTARRVSQECLTSVVCSRFSFREERARLGRFCPLLPRRPMLRRLDDDTSLLFSSQETEGLFLVAGINIPEYRPYFDGALGWSGTWLLVLFWSLCFYRFLSFLFVPSSSLALSRARLIL